MANNPINVHGLTLRIPRKKPKPCDANAKWTKTWGQVWHTPLLLQPALPMLVQARAAEATSCGGHEDKGARRRAQHHVVLAQLNMALADMHVHDLGQYTRLYSVFFHGSWTIGKL